MPLQAPKSHAIGRSAGPVAGNESTRSATFSTAAWVASARGSSTATTISSATSPKSPRIAARRSGLRPLLMQQTDSTADRATANPPTPAFYVPLT